jgi:heme-degrading monooxygenase HmoA
MIRHTVVFKLKYPKGSSEETEFLNAAKKLSVIPGIQNFEFLRQISKKNTFDYGLSMEFDTLAGYEAYNAHPDHQKFVEIYWMKYVDEFMEIDYKPM